MKQRWFALVSMCLALSWFWLFGAAGLPFATAQDPHLYTYDVLSGIQPGGASTMGTYEAADVILTQGWHYAGVNAIDIDSSPKGASVYAAIRAIDPNSQITATVSWSVNVNGCEYVSVTFARTTAASREILGEVHYLHTRASSDLYDGQSIALPTATNAVAVTQIGTLLDAPWAALKPKDPDELSQAIQAEIAARLTDTADPFAADGVGRVGNVQYVTVTGTEYAVRQMFGRLRSDGQLSGWYKQRWSDDEWPDDADGAGCASTGVHLHQAENLTEGNKLWRNADRTSDLDDDGFGFPTGQLGARRFCSDTWVFRLQSSQTDPQASPVQPCGAPTAAPANLTAAAGNGRIALRWDAPNGAPITKYEIRKRPSSSSQGTATPWGNWGDVSGSSASTTSHTLSEGLTNGTAYTLQVRAVNANGYGPAGTVSARPSASIPPAVADPALKTLALSGASLAFDSTTTSYAVTVDDDLSRTTVTATPSNSHASVTITPSDATPNTDAHDVDLAVGVTTITVAVAHDGETRTYTVTVTRPDPLAAPVVTTFKVSGTTLTGTFTWTGSSPRFLRWTLYQAPSESGAYSAVVSAVEDSQTPVVFSRQERGYSYKLRGQACEHRTEVGAQGASAGGRQAVQLVTVCGSWSAYSSAVKIKKSPPPCLTAFGAESASGESDAAADTTTICTPGSPTSLTVRNVTDSKATLHWSKATGADSYEVQIDGADVEATLGKDATSYEFTLPSADTAYKLGVAAKRGDQLSTFATLTLLKPPSSITRSTTTHNSVKYTWTDGNPTDSATAAEVKIGATGTARTADSATYHTFNNLSASTRYTFYIRLKNSQGPSAWRTKTVTTPARPTLPPRVRPAQPEPVVTTERVGQRTEYDWRPYGDLPGGLPPDPPGACYYLLFERERYRLAEFETSWRFDVSSWMWKLNPASKRQIGLETEDLFTPWVENGRRHTLTCPDPAQGVSGATAPPAGTLLPGDYVMAWGGEWFAFTIPSNAQVQWTSRTVNGQEAMVFSIAGGAEIVIIPPQIATNPPTSDDATLSAIVESFRAETDPAKLPASAQQQTCAEAPARDDAGALTLDLNAQWCSVVSSGGELSVRYDEDRISLTIPAERVWLIFAAAQSESAAAAGIWVMERQSKAYVILNPSDGAELDRHTPADAAALPALLDTIAASAVPPAE